MAENQTISSKYSISLPDVRSLIVSNPDGSYTRHINYPTIPSSPDPNSSSSLVLSKDITINSTQKTWLRLYLPRHLLDSDNHHRRLPLLVYYHGGGFIFTTADSSICHDFCNFMSERIDVVIASVDYRCAPEHRLPAAYDDAFEALQFIKSSEDNWLRQFVDMSSCFLMGSSAGGNITYQTSIQVCTSGHEIEPLKVKGLIFHHPCFGGSKRSGSELKLDDDNYSTLDATDMMWELCLPVGSDRDHEYCNPMMSSLSSSSKLIREAGLHVLLLGAYGDTLIDRELEFSKILEENGVMIATHFVEGFHAEDVVNLSKANFVCSVLKKFISLNVTLSI
ncbi:alpha/beta-Hydrolases superfamily protein [Euphorbia peplus]|nr:alpha/beta-Hydrolases superfamily protein [Euphorbia peplus]